MTAKKLALLFSLVLALALAALPIAAQDIVTSLIIGTPLNGAIENAEAGDLFRLETDMPQAVTLQVMSQTPGFAPSFRLIDGNGLVVQVAENATAQMILDRQIALSTSNLYLEVGSANGVTGSYLVVLLPSAFATGPTPLALGQSVSGSIDNATPEAMFGFNAPVDQGARLLVDSLSPNRGVTVSLRDGLSGELLALSNMRFGGVDFDIRAGSGSYFLEVIHTGTDAAEGFTVCYVGLNTQTSCAETVAPAACAVTPAGAAVNIRAGNSTDFAIVGTLPAGESAAVTGQAGGASWYQVAYNGLNGWVAASVVTASGDCVNAPVVATPVPPVVVTQAPPAVETQAPTVTPDAPTEEPDNGGDGGNGGGGIPLGPGDISAGNDDSPDPTFDPPDFDIVLPGATATPQPPGLNLNFSN